MNIIKVEGIKLYAYHGCLPEEAKIGGEYVVDVIIATDFSEAAATDDLTKTIDYCDVFNLVKQEMAIRSNLIEDVGRRIMRRLKGELAPAASLEVRVTKLNPPMNGNVQQVSIIIKE